MCIQAQIRDGKYSLVWSYILNYENAQNPYVERRQAITPWKNIASEFVGGESDQILSFDEALGHKGIKPFDALHIACAVSAGCEYFITTDKKLLNTPVPEIRIVNPIKFISEMEEWA